MIGGDLIAKVAGAQMRRDEKPPKNSKGINKIEEAGLTVSGFED